jgi:hypothetical protein
MKKCILFIAVLFCGFCVFDYLTPPTPCPDCVAKAPDINPLSDLRACERAPLFVDQNGNQTEQRIETVRSPWYPGKNLIQRLRQRKGR